MGKLLSVREATDASVDSTVVDRRMCGAELEAMAFFGLRELPASWEERWERGEVELPGDGEIVVVTGASGSGKSTLLGEMVRAARGGRGERRRVVEVGKIRLGSKPVVTLFGGVPTVEVLRRLGRVGLGEARVLFMSPGQLSEGQRFRLRLAVAMGKVRGRGGVMLVIDEFCSNLDVVTAVVIAGMLRREVSAGGGVSAVVAVCRGEFLGALGAEREVRCDFGRWEERRGREG